MFRDFPEREPNPEAGQDGAILAGAIWGFILSLYGVYQLVLFVAALVLERGLVYYLAGALAVVALGAASYLVYRCNARYFGVLELAVAMAIGGHIIHAAFSGEGGSALGVLSIAVQLAGGVFLFVQGCRDIGGSK
jgi:hypothetical protein